VLDSAIALVDTALADPDRPQTDENPQRYRIRRDRLTEGGGGSCALTSTHREPPSSTLSPRGAREVENVLCCSTPLPPRGGRGRGLGGREPERQELTSCVVSCSYLNSIASRLIRAPGHPMNLFNNAGELSLKGEATFGSNDCHTLQASVHAGAAGRHASHMPPYSFC
jgi:hypothetical protein